MSGTVADRGESIDLRPGWGDALRATALAYMCTVLGLTALGLMSSTRDALRDMALWLTMAGALTLGPPLWTVLARLNLRLRANDAWLRVTDHWGRTKDLSRPRVELIARGKIFTWLYARDGEVLARLGSRQFSPRQWGQLLEFLEVRTEGF